MSKKIPAASVLALTNGEFEAAKPATRTRKVKVEPTPAFVQPKRNGNVAALKACRTMVQAKLAGASASVRKELKTKIADYDRRIAQAVAA